MFRLLDRYLDRDVSPQELRLVEEHLTRCARCASEYRFETTLVHELREKLRRLRVPNTLLARISKMLDSERSSH